MAQPALQISRQPIGVVALLRAFGCQMGGRGFALVELLSTCPTNWGLSPTESLRWIETHMLPVFPLGVLKDTAK